MPGSGVLTGRCISIRARNTAVQKSLSASAGAGHQPGGQWHAEEIHAQQRWGYLLNAALIHALLPKELYLERLAHVQARVLDLQQRVVHQVLPPPHLQAQRQQPARSQNRLLGNLRMTWPHVDSSCLPASRLPQLSGRCTLQSTNRYFLAKTTTPAAGRYVTRAQRTIGSLSDALRGGAHPQEHVGHGATLCGRLKEGALERQPLAARVAGAQQLCLGPRVVDEGESGAAGLQASVTSHTEERRPRSGTEGSCNVTRINR